MAAKSFKDLPDECWELIFKRLHQIHYSHLESPSLTCKRFLSITNTLRTHISVIDPNFYPLSTLFNRFPNLYSISLHLLDDQDLDRVISDIATSNLNIQTLDISANDHIPLECFKILGSRMKNLRVLKCSAIGDAGLVVIADYMPCLEDLNIAWPDIDFVCLDPDGEVGVTDRGIEVVSSKLKALQKIDISGNQFLTDKSLLALSTNCVHLAEIVVHNWLVTSNGIEFLMRNSTNLRKLSIDVIQFGPLGDSICCAKSIATLEISCTEVPDESLHLLAKAGIPLKRFTLDRCSGMTLSGISSVFNNYRSLECLSLTGIDFLTDWKMSDLSQCLSALVKIRVDYCNNLTDLTFFSLAKNCPLLQDISMMGTNVGGGVGGGYMAANIVKNSRIKSLNLSINQNLTDECLATLASVCPDLEVLDVSGCKGITENGIAYFLKKGSKIRKLQINHCGGIKNIGNGSALSEFEDLGANSSGINDDGLVVIGNRCRGLLNLNLDGCLGVTTVGLKEILANCERLRNINLTGFLNASSDMVDWMMFSRPSLRMIILQYSFLPSESQRKHFLRHGCIVV